MLRAVTQATPARPQRLDFPRAEACPAREGPGHAQPRAYGPARAAVTASTTGTPQVLPPLPA